MSHAVKVRHLKVIIVAYYRGEASEIKKITVQNRLLCRRTGKVAGMPVPAGIAYCNYDYGFSGTGTGQVLERCNVRGTVRRRKFIRHQ